MKQNPKNKVPLVWHTDRRRVNDLIPFEKNPRILTDKQLEDLKLSLQKFNLAEIPAINTDNKIIAGHQRIKVLQLLRPWRRKNRSQDSQQAINRKRIQIISDYK